MTVEIALTQGQVALVDDGDADAVMVSGPWHAARRGNTFYARHKLSGDGPMLGMHTFIMGRTWVDHRNGNGLDNRRSNLRPVTPAQNVANSRVRYDNASGFKGVHRHKQGMWVAQCAGQYLGLYPTAEVAAAAYDAEALKTWGDYARTNHMEGLI